MRATRRPMATAGLALTFAAILIGGGTAQADDKVSGTITRTYVIVEDTELSGDVTCDVTGGPCFSFGAPGVELRLNGYAITGKADPVTGCGGAVTPGEFGVTTGGRPNVTIQGPGLIQRFRNSGVVVAASTNASIRDLTASTNCAAGIIVQATSFETLIEGNVAVRNGSSAPGFACGGI